MDKENKVNNNVSLKKNYFIRYTAYWTNLLGRTLLPISIVVWQFGIFKDEVSLFSKLQGTTIAGVIIAFSIIRKDIMNNLKQLENKGWYDSVKTATIWAFIFLGLWATHIFIVEMLWVVGSFAVGSAQAIITEPIHQQQLKLIKKAKGIEDKDDEKENV